VRLPGHGGELPAGDGLPVDIGDHFVEPSLRKAKKTLPAGSGDDGGVIEAGGSEGGFEGMFAASP
jgi:hypothetical protein